MALKVYAVPNMFDHNNIIILNIPLDSFDSPSSTSSLGEETCSLSPFPQNEQTSAACEPIVPLEPCPQAEHVQWPEDELSLFGGRLKDVEGDLSVTFVNVSGSENDSSLFFTTIINSLPNC